MKKFVALLVFYFSVFSLLNAQIVRDREFYDFDSPFASTISYFNVLDINWDKGLVAFNAQYKLPEIEDVSGEGNTQEPCNCYYQGWEKFPGEGLYYGVYDLNKGEVLKTFYVLKSAYKTEDCSTLDEANKNADAYLAYCKSLGLNIEWGKYKPFTDMNRYFDNNYGDWDDLHFKADYVNVEAAEAYYTYAYLFVNDENVFTVSQKEDWSMGSRGKFLFERIYSKGSKYFLFYEYFWQSGYDAPDLQVYDFTPVFDVNQKNAKMINFFKAIVANAEDYLNEEYYNVETGNDYVKITINPDGDMANQDFELLLKSLSVDDDLFLVYTNEYNPDEDIDNTFFSRIAIVGSFEDEWNDVSEQYFNDIATDRHALNSIIYDPLHNIGKFYEVKDKKRGKLEALFTWVDDKFLILKPEEAMISGQNAGKIKMGMTIDEVSALFPSLSYKEEITENEGTLFSFQEYNDLFYVYHSYDDDKISEIGIYSPIFYTEKGITTASTYEELKKTYPDLKLSNDEVYYETEWLARTDELPNVIFSFGHKDRPLKNTDEINYITITPLLQIEN